ncbi:Ubiquitin carboxyl-terminal hydrolase 7, partial [Tetrabaena socialis]
MTQAGDKRPAEAMAQFKVNVKWGKETFADVELDTTQTPLVFKSQLFALSSVPPDRQKVMIKGALLKDEEWGKAAAAVKEGMTIMLMGSAEAVSVEAPKDAPKFVEDLPESEQEHMDTKRFGAGLHNLGNTCYMNSTVQCMFAVQPLREALISKGAGAGADPTGRLVAATSELFRDLESGGAPFPPYAFLMALRAKFPQFAQQGTGGAYSQQDAEECWTNVMYALKEKVKDDDGSSVVDKLFGLRTRLTLKCDESPDEQFTEDGLSFTLKVNIEDKTAHVSEGVAVGLREERERTSAALGRPALFKGATAITQLPPYMTLQMMRFFFRRDNQQKAKILKKIPFTLEFDAYQFCSDELKKALEAPRAAHKEALDRAIEAKKLAKKGGGAAADSAAAAAATPSAAAGASDTDMKEAEAASTSAPAATTKAMTGKYELAGVVTHKGRTADSGHYVAWVKQPSDGTWVCFDDEKLTVRTEDEVLALSGGGDWHMAYLLLYRAVMADVKVEAAAEGAAAGEAAAAASAMDAEAGTSA